MSEDAPRDATDAADPLGEFLRYIDAAARAPATSESAAIDAYIATLGPASIFAVTDAIDALLRRNLTAAELTAALGAAGLSAAPPGAHSSARDWLRHVRHQLAQ